MDDHLKVRVDKPGQDRISSLPDALAAHILSFVPILDAVRTSLISKRWNRLWVSIPNLDFDGEVEPFDSHPPKLSFTNFVSKVLYLRDPVTIRELYINTSEDIKQSDIGHWLTVAVWRNVVDLTLDILLGRNLQLPPCLFSCRSLQRLHLSFFGDMSLDMPNTICFPRLKFLSVELRCFNFDFTTRLVSNCPVLDDLVIEANILFNHHIKIMSSSLTKLFLNLSDDDATVYQDCSVLVDAPKLDWLCLDDTFLPHYTVVGPALKYAKVNTGDGECGTNYPSCVYQPRCIVDILRGVSMVQGLSLSGYTMGTIVYASKNDLPTFPNLTSLKIGVQYCCGLKSLPDILKNCVRLKRLVLMKESTHLCAPVDELEWKPPSEFLLVNPLLMLEVVEMREFEGEIHELELIKYLLKNALELKMFTIWAGTSVLEKGTLHKKVLSFPKASIQCVFDFRGFQS